MAEEAGFELSETIASVLIFLISVAGAYYANELRKALAGSELAEVWKYVGATAVLLFVGSLLGGIVALAAGEELGLEVFLFIMVPAAATLTYGLYLQAQKVK